MRRLERIKLAGAKCEECGESEKELHIHHKQYFKDRMPWDYEDEQLMCVCAMCHVYQESIRLGLRTVLSRVDPGSALLLLCDKFGADKLA